jgi:hypothetical protein
MADMVLALRLSGLLARASVAHYRTMKTSAVTIRLDRALDRQLAMLTKRPAA